MNSVKEKLAGYRPLLAACVGGGLEIYDLTIYLFFAPIMSKLFFADHNTFIDRIELLVVFALGYFIRPIGGLLVAYIGDKYGRRLSLLISIVTMGLASFLIGCLPTYQQVGIAAPILLIVLRIFQGLAVGGDLPGGIAYVAEFSRARWRGLNCAIVFMGVNFGLLFASAVSTTLNQCFSAASVEVWGWRIGFYISGLLLLIGIYLRRRLKESTLFEAAKAQNILHKNPVIEIFKIKKLLRAAIGWGFVWLHAAIILQIFVYMPTFLSDNVKNVSFKDALVMNTVSLLVFSILIPVMGYISDRVGRKRFLSVLSVAFIVLSYPLYMMIVGKCLLSVIVSLLIFDVLSAAAVGTIPAALSELFETPVRYTGVSLSYNVSFAVIGGVTPLLLAAIDHIDRNHHLISLNLIFAAMVCFIAAVFFVDKTDQAI